MITVLVSVAFGLFSDADTGWAVFFALILFQLIVGDV
jgi:hypothetical protein